MLGQCVHQKTVRVPDLCTEQRWPEFARRACELGAGSMLSFQLFVEGDNLGALNLISCQRGGFDEESEHVGLPFAAYAAIAFAAADKQDQMRQAIHTRDLIGQAKGILMERFKIDADQAFHILTKASQHTNRKLRDVAEQLVYAGDLAGPRQ